MLGERGKVGLECCCRGCGVRGERYRPVLVYCSCKCQGEDASDAFEVSCSDDREFGCPLFMIWNGSGD
jgi:hypothetical protein